MIIRQLERERCDENFIFLNNPKAIQSLDYISYEESKGERKYALKVALKLHFIFDSKMQEAWRICIQISRYLKPDFRKIIILYQLMIADYAIENFNPHEG